MLSSAIQLCITWKIMLSFEANPEAIEWRESLWCRFESDLPDNEICISDDLGMVSEMQAELLSEMRIFISAWARYVQGNLRYPLRSVSPKDWTQYHLLDQDLSSSLKPNLDVKLIFDEWNGSTNVTLTVKTSTEHQQKCGLLLAWGFQLEKLSSAFRSKNCT